MYCNSCSWLGLAPEGTLYVAPKFSMSTVQAYMLNYFSFKIQQTVYISADVGLITLGLAGNRWAHFRGLSRLPYIRQREEGSKTK